MAVHHSETHLSQRNNSGLAPFQLRSDLKKKNDAYPAYP